MTKENKEIQKEFLKEAKARDIKIFKNNIAKAKPIESVCGFMETKYPTQFRDLCTGR
jgi:hypothetical protein